MTRYKVINKTFSPLRFNGIGTIPARGFVIVDKVPEEIRAFRKTNKIDIKKVSI